MKSYIYEYLLNNNNKKIYNINVNFYLVKNLILFIIYILQIYLLSKLPIVLNVTDC